MTNTPPVGSDAERKLFEAFLKTPAPATYDATNADAWHIWQAARALPALPEPGMRVVPVEPTPEMQQAAMAAWMTRRPFPEVYQAMLAAAPSRAVGDGREPLSDATQTALNIALTTLNQIADTPRNKGARKRAFSTVKFLETQLEAAHGINPLSGDMEAKK